MEIIIQSLHFKVNDHLEKFVKDKVNKLSRLNNQALPVEVNLRLEKSKQSENKVCEIKVPLPGKTLFAKRQSESFEEAINSTIDALQQQIKKRKTQVNKNLTV